MGATLSKEERLCGKTAIDNLVHKGRWGGFGHLKYCTVSNEGAELNRILVSVPKKYFKRAVKRNLLKRRMREAYRTQKELLGTKGHDLMLVYSSPEVAPYSTIREEVASILEKMNPA
ncbi:MAG: ribonuclease P protein component [Bacteroidales bacterium]|nr:ribonuclease P protein component [Candidatus Cryptobacteroides equifaecalis]